MTESIDWAVVLVGLFGGLALFLIGMDQMTDALKSLAGHRLQRILSRLSGNRFTGALTGTVTTAALQSSSVTTVLAVGFVSAELLKVTQAASVIIGANLGATITAQIIALNVSELALALVAVGAVFWLFVPSRTWKKSGQALAALGFVFFGIKVMSDAMMPLASYPPVFDALAGSSNPLIALLAGAAITAVIQSSSATTGIVISMAAAGLVDLPTGIAVVLGANIGTCVTALLAALGKGRPALRTAMVHVLVNVLGALAWLVFLPLLVDLVEYLNPSDVASPRQLANAHTIFNLVNTIVFLILLTPLIALVTRLVPAKSIKVGEAKVSGRFLDETATGTAALGLPAATRETVELGNAVRTFFVDGFANAVLMPIDEAWTDESINDVKTDLRERHRTIVGYLAELSHSARDDAQSHQLLALVSEADELAHLTDSVASALRRINRRRRRTRAQLDHQMRQDLTSMESVVSADLASALAGSRGVSAADVIEDHREQIAAQRLGAQLDMDRYVLESDLLELLARVSLGADRIHEVRSLAALRDR
jgi:phosphate:Na+ symporter